MHFASMPRAAACLQLLLLAACLAPLHPASAQSFCASDGQSQPVQLMERFINADCDTCWQDPATPKADDAHSDKAVLDWIVPNDAGGKGDDAPLSAVASRDGLSRLAVLGKSMPRETLTVTQTVSRLKSLKENTLRVAHGLPLSGYLGTSIELKPVPSAAKQQRWTVWLALVETLPAGTEGSPVVRNLVRNVFQATWSGGQNPSKTEPNRFFDARSMSIAQGVNPDRLRVIGWVEDAKGQVLAAAQSRCASQ